MPTKEEYGLIVAITIIVVVIIIVVIYDWRGITQRMRDLCCVTTHETDDVTTENDNRYERIIQKRSDILNRGSDY